EGRIDVPAVPAACDLPSVADEVVREPDSWTEIVRVELALGRPANRFERAQGEGVELVLVRPGLKFVPKPEIQRQLRRRFPVVLDVLRRVGPVVVERVV